MMVIATSPCNVFRGRKRVFKVVSFNYWSNFSEVIHGVTNICQMTMDAEFYRVTLWLDILQSLLIYKISPLSVGFRFYSCFPSTIIIKFSYTEPVALAVVHYL